MVAFTEQQLEAIGQVIQITHERQRIRHCEVEKFEKFREYLEMLCQAMFDCKLELFGSTKNGFGTKDSDADVCLHVDPYSLRTQQFLREKHQRLAMTSLPYNSAVLLSLASDLSRVQSLQGVTAILTARVPVIKMSCSQHFDGLQADLTISNDVAIHNTRLLRHYGKLDPRVRQLGIALKVWMKCCSISGASEGWVSSYAYVIMLIYFLQRTDPPVLPYLQQVSSSKKPKRPVMIGGWDVYFYSSSDMSWVSPNHQTVGELWLNFFNYYAWSHDFENDVIQIRYPKTLTKQRKAWDNSAFAIEDPFVLNHNLAASVDAGALSHMKETFALTYWHFANSIFLQCSEDLDISHAKRLYKVYNLSPSSAIYPSAYSPSRCSDEDSHFFDSGSLIDAIAGKRLTTDSGAASLDSEEASSSSFETDTNFSSEMETSSLASDPEAIFLENQEDCRQASESDASFAESVKSCGFSLDCRETFGSDLAFNLPSASGSKFSAANTSRACSRAVSPELTSTVKRRTARRRNTATSISYFSEAIAVADEGIFSMPCTSRISTPLGTDRSDLSPDCEMSFMQIRRSLKSTLTRIKRLRLSVSESDLADLAENYFIYHQSPSGTITVNERQRRSNAATEDATQSDGKMVEKLDSTSGTEKCLRPALLPSPTHVIRANNRERGRINRFLMNILVLPFMEELFVSSLLLLQKVGSSSSMSS